MPTLRENVFSRCTTYASLVGLIGNRCYPGRLPEEVDLPALTYSQVSEDDNSYRSHGESTPRSVARITFDCWAETSDDAAEVADALVSAWDGHTSNPDIGWSRVMLRLDNYEAALNRFRTVVDVLIDYARA